MNPPVGERYSRLFLGCHIAHTSALVVAFSITRAFKAKQEIFLVMCRTLSVSHVLVGGGTKGKENLDIRRGRFLRVLYEGVKFFLTPTARDERLANNKAIPLNVSSGVIRHNGILYIYPLTTAFQISRLHSAREPLPKYASAGVLLISRAL